MSSQHILLQGDTHKPLIDQVIIPLNDKSRIIEEVVNNLPITPSTILIEQRKRRIPMEQHRRDLEVLLDKLCDDIVVVLHAFFVDRAFAEGEDARPGDGKAERRHAQILQAREVLFVEVVMRGGDVSGRVVGDLVDDTVAEEVPNRRTFAFGIDGALRSLLAVLLGELVSQSTSIWNAEEATPQEKPSGSDAALRFVS